MGHPDHRFDRAVFDRGVEEVVEHRNGRLGAFEREAFVADVLRVQELLERLGVVELHQDAALGGPVERLVIARRLHPVLQPFLLDRFLDVHVLRPDFSAVRLAQRVEDVAQLRGHPAAQVRRRRIRARGPRSSGRRTPGSSSGWRWTSYSSGSRSASRWPRTR